MASEIWHGRRGGRWRRRRARLAVVETAVVWRADSCGVAWQGGGGEGVKAVEEGAEEAEAE
jgi:hypothetical protein